MDTLDERTIADLADELRAAREEHAQVEPLTNRHDPSVEDAYRIQSELVGEAHPDDRRIGYKVGVTNEEGQAAMGADEPAYGVLFDDMLVAETVVDTGELIDPRIEPEIGFVLDRALPESPTVLDVLAATRAVVPTVEIPDSRIADWNVRIEDMIADNALAGRLIAGDVLCDPSGIDLSTESVRVLIDGEIIETGVAVDVLGHPARAVSWLANRLPDHDRSLSAGDLILSGSLTSPLEVSPGDVVTIEFAAIGSVTFRME